MSFPVAPNNVCFGITSGVNKNKVLAARFGLVVAQEQHISRTNLDHQFPNSPSTTTSSYQHPFTTLISKHVWTR